MTAKQALILALILVGAVNVFVLCGVAYNRSGKEAVLPLTERELVLETHEKDDTSISLKLDLGNNPEIPDEKLRKLGFDLDRAYKKDSHQYPSRKVFVVLEFEGPAWQKWLSDNSTDLAEKEKLIRNLEKSLSSKNKSELENEEEKAASLKDSRQTQSHLFMVEVALGADTLRKAYPDRTHYAIVPALLEVYSFDNGTKTIYNTTLRVLNEQVHVGQELRPFFEGKAATDKFPWDAYNKRRKTDWNPRYEVDLAFGQRFEPWIVSCKPLPVVTPSVVNK